jgi:predicted HicB family RNase H-like nuclease
VGRKQEKKRKARYDTTLLLRLTKEMHERLREFADKHGLSVSAAIRLLIAEALMKERERERK